MKCIGNLKVIRTATTALALCAALGCGSGGNEPAATTGAYGPHGGPAVPLPGGKGFGEVVLEPADSGGRGKSRQIAVYFLGPDLKSALEPLPTGAGVKLLVPGRDDLSTIALAPKPATRSPAGKGRFTSAPGDYQVDQVIGELEVAFGGEKSTIPFASAR